MNLLELCDTSHWQRDDVFKQLIENDKMIILKATQGVNYIDETLYKRFLYALPKKLRFLGVYHYLDKKYRGDEQASHFFNIYQMLSKIAIHINIKLVPILDFEESTEVEYNRFYDKWYELCDTSLVTYTSYSWAKTLDFTNRLLWCAGWTYNTDRILQRMEEYPTMILYQYTNKYDVNNNFVDRNYFIESRFENLFYYDTGVNV